MKFKNIRYLLETPFIWFGLVFFRLFSPNIASNIGAKIAIKIHCFLKNKLSVNKLAFDNLSHALPDLNQEQKLQIIVDMWDNFGRIIGEFIHICKMDKNQLAKYVEIDEETSKNIENLKASGKGGIIFSAHFGNWEIGPKILLQNGLKVKTIYRPLNNPYAENLTSKIRNVAMIAKGSAGNREIINAIKNNEFIIIMADQKITDGEPIKFFNRNAITSTSIAKIALKYGVPIIPGYISRIGKKFKFKLTIENSLIINRNENFEDNIKNVTLKINQIIENWIKASPHQWFWVHNRWKK
ncbi:MAG: lysophospholipid acyltransferase family protein [Alphaproteobacteria bacterium]